MRSYHTPKRRSTGKIGISMLSNKITNRMIIYLLLFELITHFGQGIETKEPDGEQLKLGGDRENPDHSRVKRGKQRYMPIDEMQGFVWKEIQIIEELRKKCVTGTFFSLVTKDCKSCDKHCQNGTDMKSCGKECIGYYDDIKYKKLQKMVVDLKSEVQSMGGKEHEKPDLTFVWIAYGALVIGFLVFAVITVVKIKTWETKRCNDQKSVNDELRKLKEKAIPHSQQASPDTSPESTPDTTPVSTLSRHTVTTPLIEGNQQHNSRQDVQELRIIEDNPQDNQGGRVFNA